MKHQKKNKRNANFKKKSMNPQQMQDFALKETNRLVNIVKKRKKRGKNND